MLCNGTIEWVYLWYGFLVNIHTQYNISNWEFLVLLKVNFLFTSIWYCKWKIFLSIVTIFFSFFCLIFIILRDMRMPKIPLYNSNSNLSDGPIKIRSKAIKGHAWMPQLFSTNIVNKNYLNFPTFFFSFNRFTLLFLCGLPAEVKRLTFHSNILILDETTNQMNNNNNIISM